jgi:hypothetical protein
MRDDLESNSQNVSAKQEVLLCFTSVLLGGAAIWFSWLRFTNLFSRPNVSWYEWIQPSMVVLFAFLCLVAAILFVLRKPDAVSFFKLGLSVIPLILFINLVILLFRAAASVWQGDAGFILERVLSQPHKFILIPLIIIAWILLDRLSKSKDQKTG